MNFGKQVSLKNFSNFRIGGPARDFVQVESLEELVDTVQTARQVGLPVFVLGGGTNILWGDDGFEGVIIQPAFDYIQFDGTRVTAGAGVPMERFLTAVIARGLAGLEWAGGLPGSFGGAIYGNAGCFGGEIKDVIEEVVSFDIENLKIVRRTREECEFGYRTSIFKAKRLPEVIIQATIGLGPGNKLLLSRSVEEKIRYREERQPLEYPNIGSIFKNVRVEGLPEELVDPHRHVIKVDPFPVIPAAHLIAKARLKGLTAGGALVSPKHPNFIVNAHQAKAADVLELIGAVKERVRDELGIGLEEEVLIIV